MINNSCKHSLREYYKNLRKSKNKQQCLELSSTITSKVVSCKIWQESRSVGLYISVNNEVNTAKLIDIAWEQNKKVAIPRCINNQGLMEFVWYNKHQSLQEDHFGIPSLNSNINYNLPINLDLIIVPGLAFTKNGLRMGQGKGYYDRILSTKAYQNSFKLGLAFFWQIAEELPIDSFDVKMDAVCSELDFYYS